MLGVRQSSPSDICLVELGQPSLNEMVRGKQESYFRSVVNNRTGMADDPLMCVLEITKYRNSTYGYIESLIDNSLDPLPSPKQRVETSTGTKAVIYRTINSDLGGAAVYKSEEHAVPEYARISFTRMRLSSHKLRIETGRWARVKREDRTCRCGEDVQDERHVLQFCSLADEVRGEQGLCFPDCLNNCQPPNILKIHNIYKFYDDL